MPVVLEQSFPLSQSVSFTGASADTAVQGSYVGLDGVSSSFSHLGGPLQIEFFGFNFNYPTGFSSMGIDLLMRVDGLGGKFEQKQRYTPAARFNSDVRRLTWSFAALAPGTYDISLNVRGVLFNGPPITVQITDSATLRVATALRTISFSPSAPQVVNAGSSFRVRVEIAAPEPNPVIVSLTSANSRVSLQLSSIKIPAGATSTEFEIGGTTGGSDVVTASATDFLPAALEVAVRPVLSSVTPEEGPADTVVTLNGNGFDVNASVIWGHSVAYQASFASSTSLQAKVPQFNPGAVSVGVEVGGAGSQQVIFKVTLGPRIDSFSPTSGQVGDVVTINGKNLIINRQNSEVFFGNQDMTWGRQDHTFSATEIACTVPLAASSGPITVKTSAGRATSANSFKVVPPTPPIINSFSPSSGEIGTYVSIIGSQFHRVTAVQFNGVKAEINTFTEGFIKAIVPDNAKSGPITLIDSLTADTTSAESFIVVPTKPPIISAFAPSSGGVGTYVLIHGDNFKRVTAVKFNGVSAEFRRDFTTQIGTVVPLNASSGPITVTTSTGQATSASPFSVTGIGFGSLAFYNQTLDDTITVWVVVTNTGQKATETLSPEQRSSIMTLHTGGQYQYFVTSHKWVADYNTNFNENVDPKAFDTACTVNFQRVSSSVFPGLDGGQPLNISIT